MGFRHREQKLQLPRISLRDSEWVNYKVESVESFCLVDSARPNILWSRSFIPRICSYSVDFRPVPRRFAPVVPKHEFVEIDLELRLAHSVIGTISHVFRI